MKKLILIVGAPGSGKTTDAEIIASNNSKNIVHYSTGDLLRDEVASKSELGNEIDGYISKGNLVPLKIVVGTIVSAINKSPRDTVIIDGYPRSIEQMDALEEFLNNENNINLIAVIKAQVSEATAMDRVLGRARGADDNVEVFKNRMKVFTEPMENIAKFYKNKNIYHEVDAERSIEEIVKDMENLINKIIG
jgi:adenylate kinase